jgi:NADH-quinone oxidoreductase subunit G
MVTDEVRMMRAKVLYEDDKAKQVRCSHQNPYVKRLYKEFLEKPLSEKSEKLLHTTYKGVPIYRR